MDFCFLSFLVSSFFLGLFHPRGLSSPYGLSLKKCSNASKKMKGKEKELEKYH
jgi:hypothetical protein